MSLRALSRPFVALHRFLFRRAGIRRLMIEWSEACDVTMAVDDKEPPIRLHVASRMENQRTSGFFDKEPDTIAWLDQLQPGDLFVDIGANIGVYSLYAAARRGARVLAFEPESQNYAALNRNIHVNRLGHAISALPIALSDQSGPTVLNLTAFRTGGSHSTVDEAVGEGGGAFSPAFVQGTVSETLDAVLAALDGGAPRFVKIDVDGAEARVIAGMAQLLGSGTLEQVLIELAPEQDSTDAEIATTLNTAGYTAGPPAWLYHGRGNHIFRRT